MEERGLGWVLTGEVGIYTRVNPYRVRAADVVFVSSASSPTLPTGFLETPPDMVAEIVSPNDRWQDIREKIEEYFTVGLKHVWIVEPGLQAILLYESPTTVVRLVDDDLLKGAGRLQGFELHVSALFSDPARRHRIVD